MSNIYQRPELAKQMARQLLQPGVLDEGLRSGLFLSGLRRTGKTTFLINDLIPALEDLGAIVIYVDLWSDTQRSPARLILEAVRKTLTELESPSSTILRKLKRLASADIAAFGFKFSFKLDTDELPRPLQIGLGTPLGWDLSVQRRIHLAPAGR